MLHLQVLVGTNPFLVMGMSVLRASPVSFLHVWAYPGESAASMLGLFRVAGQQETTCEANGSVYYVGEWYF